MGAGEGRVVWRVTESNAPSLWRIEGTPESGDARVTIAYSLRMDGQDTVFERNMQYQFNRLWLRVLDLLFICLTSEQELQEALSNAKQILEH